MGSGAETAHETVDWLVARGEKVGVLKVRLFRPFDVARFAAALPTTVRAIAVLDRTKEPGAVGEPLYQDVVTALVEAGGGTPPRGSSAGGTASPRRSSRRRWSPASSRSSPSRSRATTSPSASSTTSRTRRFPGTRTSTSSRDDVSRAVFFGLGSDGTVGANKNSIKILGEETDAFAQAYFVYDSKKSGAVTVSHLRFVAAPDPLGVSRPPRGLRRLPPVRAAAPPRRPRARAREGATLLLNAPYGPDEVWDQLPREVQEEIVAPEAQALRRRRLPDRARGGPEGPHQHDHADLLLRALRRRCRARRRSRRSRRRSRRPTRRRAPRS